MAAPPPPPPPTTTILLPFLHIFKNGHLLDTLPLHGKDTFVMGRHVDCDVLLTHPSVSRHHLQLQLLHATHEILLTDLESVHGTWINEQRLESRCTLTAKANDTIRVGASSRNYKIQWISDFLPCDEQSEKDLPVRSVESAYSKAGSITEIVSNTTCNSTSRSNNKESHYAHDERENRFSDLCGSGEKTSTTSSAQILRKESLDVPASKGPACRIPLAPLQQAAVEESLPRSPNVKRKLPLEKTANDENEMKNTVSQGEVKEQRDRTRKQASLNLWLRRCNSAPPPTVQTVLPSAPPMPVEEEQDDQVTDQLSKAIGSSMVEKSNQDCKQLIKVEEQKMLTWKEDEKSLGNGTSLSRASSFSEVAEEDFPSDKENLPPLYPRGKMKDNISIGMHGDSTGPMEVSRRPFQPLFLTSKGDYRPSSPSVSYPSTKEGSLQRSGLAAPQRKSSSVAQSLDQMLRRLKMMDGVESRYHWHIVVDTSCFIDQASFRCLQQLQGIKETRIIIPKIVVRELDNMKRRDGLKSGPSGILKWIETCMMKIPSWIHVQNSFENLPVRATPPSSPHQVFSPYGSLGDLMSPTNDDHVLECALLFNTTVVEGQVALLTNHTALKIKAMAEGLICESATAFCESLLSPYSERFLWAGSMAHGPNWIKPYHGKCNSVPAATLTSDLQKKTLISAAREIAYGKHHVVEGLKNHCNQAQGLRVVLD